MCIVLPSGVLFGFIFVQVVSIYTLGMGFRFLLIWSTDMWEVVIYR